MDVKDVNATKAVKTKAQDATKIARRSARELSADKVNIARTESVTVEVRVKPEAVKNTRDRANSAINALNLVAGATEDIDKIVTSLAGIAEQADQTNLPDSRREVLEQEAQQLVKAIAKKVNIESSPGVRPLKGDPLRVEIEEELGKALEVILPDTSPENLGLSAVTLSPADQIIRTRQVIGEARSQLEALRTKVADSKTQISTVLTELDIATENQRAAESQVRDVDQALQLTGNIQDLVNESPSAAINASALESDSVRLLTTE